MAIMSDVPTSFSFISNSCAIDAGGFHILVILGALVTGWSVAYFRKLLTSAVRRKEATVFAESCCEPLEKCVTTTALSDFSAAGHQEDLRSCADVSPLRHESEYETKEMRISNEAAHKSNPNRAVFDTSHVTAAARSGNMQKAAKLFEDFLEAGGVPDHSAFLTIIRGYCSMGDVEQAMSSFKAMRRWCIVPSVHVFDTMLKLCANMNTLCLIDELLSEMEHLGVRMSNTTLSILMRVHGQQGDLCEVFRIFEVLPQKHSLKVNSQAYGTLISVCLSSGRLDLALDVFDRMPNEALVTSRTYEALVTGCFRSGSLDRAVSLIDVALQLGDASQCAVNVRRSSSPAHLEVRVIEELLSVAGRRGHASRLAVPLLARLESAGVEIAHKVSAAVLRAAEQERARPCSLLDIRRTERQCWRNFSRSFSEPTR